MGNMRQFVAVLSLAAVSLAAPAAQVLAKPYINTGSASGPLTPAVGDLVATPKGYRSLALEGFSEDLNQDGFVDPIGQAVPVVHTPLVAAPAISYGLVKAPEAVEKVEVKAAPAVATYAVNVPAATVPYHPVTYQVAQPVVHTAPVVQHVGYQVHHQVPHVPQVSVQKHVTHHTTQHVINHAPVIGAFTGLVPATVGVIPDGVSAIAAPVEEAPAVEEA